MAEVTISTHNGSTVHTAHNLRNASTVSHEPHIDQNGIHETWVHEDLKKAYMRLFGEAQKAYNKKQSREDRKISSYYETVKADKRKHVAYEMIVGVYGKGEIIQKTQKEILKAFVDGWKERNPTLELVGAYYHADEEGEPHIHVDYIPIAHGYARGMETQTGLVKALQEMGFCKDGKETEQIQWERRENKVLEDLCFTRCLQVKHPGGERHVSTKLYKAQKKLESILEDIKDATAQREFLVTTIQSLDEYYEYCKTYCKTEMEKQKNLTQELQKALKDTYSLAENMYDFLDDRNLLADFNFHRLQYKHEERLKRAEKVLEAATGEREPTRATETEEEWER